ncbi:MAG: precorrin-6y C5,15-methyltransferase (decarboxylating) subunit CbiE, partial [Planctomycetaceae bacterium]|nr:precorrin-6y C5,15-methyltransferase (decarboxylating) subunit CbiE [Planctomycetaceae bacterium]
MAVVNKVHVVGISDDGLQGLSSLARERLEAADLVIGDTQLLDLVEASDAEKWDPAGHLDEVVDRIATRSTDEIVILASGDPLFYGMARFLCERLGKDRFEVLPHVSSMQMAFARVKESWDDAYLTNLANQSVERVVERIRTAGKVGIFTTEENSPSVVATACLERGIDYFTAYVCENLGSPDERVTVGDLNEIDGEAFAPLNVMILVRKPDVPDRPVAMVGRRLFGNPDEMFLQSQPKRGLLTPAEVRSVALAEMDLGPNSVVWDVGAG